MNRSSYLSGFNTPWQRSPITLKGLFVFKVFVVMATWLKLKSKPEQIIIKTLYFKTIVLVQALNDRLFILERKQRSGIKQAWRLKPKAHK